MYTQSIRRAVLYKWGSLHNPPAPLFYRSELFRYLNFAGLLQRSYTYIRIVLNQ